MTQGKDFICIVKGHVLCSRWNNRKDCDCLIRLGAHPYKGRLWDHSLGTVPHCQVCGDIILPGVIMTEEDTLYRYIIRESTFAKRGAPYEFHSLEDVE